MKCEQAEVLMGELLAGELRPEERTGLDRHLMDCASCRLDFEAARAGFRADWPDSPPARRTVDATLASFREAPAILRFLRVGTAAAAAIILAVLLLGSGGRARPAAETVTAAPAPPRYLASMQEAVVGSLVAKDEDGRPAGELGLQSHVVSVEILDGIAKTTVEENFHNHTDRRLEGTFRFPLPSDASISRLALEVNGRIEEGTCLERERAREVFEGIVRKMKDPALLEWMPGGMFQCRIFPIEPRATKRVIVAYTQALPQFRGKSTYVYPLASEKTRQHPPEELRIDVTAKFAAELRRIESPSHRLDVQRARPNEARMTFAARNLRPENDFVLTMETADEELRVVPHKVDGDDGYFALFLTPRGAAERKPGSYAFVIDASASVTGPELEVARRVVRAMMERRIEGDRFEVIGHHIDVRRSGEVDLRAANDFMDGLVPLGGCDVLKALQAAPAESEIVYIGGGTPTFGETETAKILEAVKGRRIRTVGIGSRVNATLLERLGGHFRISPNDDVGKRCIEIAATLGSSPLSEIQVEGGDAVYDVVGVRDVFHGERLVVTGRYRGPAARLAVTGRDFRRELAVAFPAKEEGNNYVRRLWAQRKISDLLTLGESKKAEITELGVRHQIMTPYTSFLVLENEQMWKDHQLKREVQKQDELTGKKGKESPAPEEPAYGEKVRQLLQDATDLYKLGKGAEAAAKFEEAFLMKPSSDQVWAFMKQIGDDKVARMMNDPERKIQDVGRRLFELAKPGEFLREGQAVVARYIEDLKNTEDPAVWRSAFWHLRNMGPHAVGDVLPALGDKANDRYRSRVGLLLTEIGAAAAPAVTEALKSADPFVRQQAAIVLGNIKDPRPLAELTRLRDDATQPAEVKKFAEEAVRKINRTPSPETAEESREKAIREAYEEQLKRERQEFSIRPVPGNPKEEPRPLVAPAPPPPTVKPPDPRPETPQELQGKIEEYRAKLAKSLNEKSLAVSEMEYARQMVGRLGGEIEKLQELRARALTVPDQGSAGKFRSRGDRGVPLLDGTPLTGALFPVEEERRGRSTEIPDFDLQIATAAVALDPVVKTLLPGIFTLTTNVTAPGAPITDALPMSIESVIDSGVIDTETNSLVIRTGLRSKEQQMAEMRRNLERLDESRVRLERSLRSSDLPETRKQLERLNQDLGELEGRSVDMARDKKHLEEKLNHLSSLGVRDDVAPKKPLEGKVTAVAIELGLVVISIGKDTGVMEGDEFTIYRGGAFVAKIQIDRADRQWAAGKVVLKKSDPRVADDASNHIFVSAPGAEKVRSLPPAAGTTAVAPRKPLEGKVTAVANEIGLVVISLGKDDGVQEGDEFIVGRSGEFASKIVIDRADRKWSVGKVILKKTDPRVGDDVSNRPSKEASAKAEEERADRVSRRNLQVIREKMGY